MAIVNGKSTYGTTNLSRNSSKGKAYAKKLQEEANKRNIPSAKKPAPKATVVRNPEFDQLTEAQKKQNAEYLNSSDPKIRELGISHIKEVPTGNGTYNIKDKLSREEKLAQYQNAFKSSPYTPENVYLTTLNKKKELQIKPNVNPHTKRAESAVENRYVDLTTKRKQFGMEDARTAPKSKDWGNLQSSIRKEYQNTLSGKISQYQGAFNTKWSNARNSFVGEYLTENIKPFRFEIEKQNQIIAENQKQLDFYNSPEYRKDGIPKGVKMRMRSMNQKIDQAKKNIKAIEDSVKSKGEKVFDEQNKPQKDSEYQTLQEKIAADRKSFEVEKNQSITEEKERYENQKTQFGTNQDFETGTAGESSSSLHDTLLERFEIQQKRAKEDYQKKIEKKREEEWEQIKVRAEDATTTEEKEEYLAREKRRLDRVYGNLDEEQEGELMAEFLEEQTVARSRKEEDLLNDQELNILKTAEKQKGKTASPTDLQNAEKLAFIKAFVGKDNGDPSTAIGRALKAYERISKTGSEEEALSEFELGDELDRKLSLYNKDKENTEALPPERAYEWLISQDVSIGVAEKMLKYRGIDDEILQSQKEKKLKELGFSDEDIALLDEKAKEKSASETYLKGLMTSEQEEVYLDRLMQKSLATKGEYKLKTLAEEYAKNFSREELVSGRVLDGEDT